VAAMMVRRAHKLRIGTLTGVAARAHRFKLRLRPRAAWPELRLCKRKACAGGAEVRICPGASARPTMAASDAGRRCRAPRTPHGLTDAGRKARGALCAARLRQATVSQSTGRVTLGRAPHPRIQVGLQLAEEGAHALRGLAQLSIQRRRGHAKDVRPQALPLRGARWCRRRDEKRPMAIVEQGTQQQHSTRCAAVDFGLNTLTLPHTGKQAGSTRWSTSGSPCVPATNKARRRNTWSHQPHGMLTLHTKVCCMCCVTELLMISFQH